MGSKWFALGGLSFGIGFCLSAPLHKNLEKSFIAGLGASASTVSAISILGKFNKVDEDLYRSRLYLSDQKDKIEKELDLLQSQKASSGESLALVIEQIDKKKEINVELSNKVSQLKLDNTKIETQFEETTSKLKGLKFECENIYKEVEEAKIIVNQLERRKTILEEQIINSNKQKVNIESLYNEKEKNLKIVEQTIESLNTQEIHLQSKVKILRQEHENRNQDIVELDASITDLEAKKDKKILEKEEIDTLIQALNSQVRDKRNNIKELKLEIEELKENIEVANNINSIVSPLSFIYPNNASLNSRQEEIKRICNNEKISNCIHITKIENLSKIIAQGLVPRKYLGEDDFHPNVWKREDDHWDANCLNINYPNKDILNGISRARLKNYVILCYRKEILWELDCAFYLADSDSDKIAPISIEERKSPKVLENILLNNGDFYRLNKLEVLVFNRIPTFYLEEVTFYDDTSLDLWINKNQIYFFNGQMFKSGIQIEYGGCESAKTVNEHN